MEGSAAARDSSSTVGDVPREGAAAREQRDGGAVELRVQLLQEEEEEEMRLKREISCHPMFGLLKGTHLNCLKVCSGDDQKEVPTVVRGEDRRPQSPPENQRDLDLFMEAYCTALVELTQAIQKPMQEATAFIDFMYCVLGEVASDSSTTGKTHSTDE